MYFDAHSDIWCDVTTRRLNGETNVFDRCHPVSYTHLIASCAPVEQAIVTSGGVKVSEVSPKTMESKLVKGLYFAGELLDVDAYTGGFNLQIAWATGRLAGNSCAQEG